MPTTHPIAWHPSFASACQLELLPFKGGLHFETEHELNAQPLRIDLLVVKKDPGLHIDLDIAAMFRGHHILEFKSEQDGLNFDDLCKVVAYECLYKTYGTREGSIRLDDVTLTLVRHRKPRGLFKAIDENGFKVSPAAQGIYRIEGPMFPTQVIVTGELNPAEHIWLASLVSDLETSQVRQLFQAAQAVQDETDRVLVDSVMTTVTLANNDAVEQLKEEDEMYKTLREIMGTDPRFIEEMTQIRLNAATEAAAKAAAKGLETGMAEGMKQGIAQGMAEGMAQGVAQGTAEAVRATVERLLRRGGFSDEEVAQLAGTTTSEVRAVADAMGMAVA